MPQSVGVPSNYGSRGVRVGEGRPYVVFDLPGQGIVVFFKPPGWEVDDDGKLPSGKRLSAFLQWNYPWSAVARDGEHAFGIIHRLDLPSSGLILTGTTFEGHYRLKWQLDTGQIAREYVVLCHGWVAPSLNLVDAPVHHIPDKHTAKRTLSKFEGTGRSTVTEMGKPAQTFIKVLAHLLHGTSRPKRLSLLVCRIRTGRRHQIRAHLHHVEHPTVADGKYTAAEVFLSDIQWCPRNFLHRQRLVFHDAEGIEREVVEPLPHDLRTALGHLVAVGSTAAKVSLAQLCAGSRPCAWEQYVGLVEESG